MSSPSRSSGGRATRSDVAPGTLTDPVVALCDAGWTDLAFSDDHGDSLAQRIYREAMHSGTHYIVVRGYDSGSYTLTMLVR